MAGLNGHETEVYQGDVDRLRALIIQMGGMAEHAIREALRCLVQHDLEGARRIVESDTKLDALEREAERSAIQLIVLRAPMSDDLREVITALKVARVVERIGEYGKNIARRVLLLENTGNIEPIILLRGMTRIVTEMMHDVLTAFLERDADAAVRVCERDRAVDDFYNSIFRTLLTFMMENPGYISQSTHLLFIAKNIERVGDHAANIAEMVYHAATGQHHLDPSRESRLLGVER